MRPRTVIVPLLMLLIGPSGCGTTRITDTQRSASEELLLSHAIDRSVGELNLEVLAGQRVYLETQNLTDVSFRGYLTSAVRQHLLASGALLVDEPDMAQVIVEVRAGAVSTGKHDSLIGFPQTTVPGFLFGVPATIPEIAFVKKTIHIGVAKVGVFAYRAEDGAGVWQSGIRENQSKTKNKWFLGMGPYQSGDVVLTGAEHPWGLFQPRKKPQVLGPLEFEQWVGEIPVPGEPPPVRKPEEDDPEPEDEPDSERRPVPPDLVPPAPDEPLEWLRPVEVPPDLPAPPRNRRATGSRNTPR
jgi:hypothetical protein